MKMTEIKKLSPMNFSVDKLRIIKKTEKAWLDLNPDIVSRPLRYYQGFPPPNQASGCIIILKLNKKWKSIKSQNKQKLIQFVSVSILNPF